MNSFSRVSTLYLYHHNRICNTAKPPALQRFRFYLACLFQSWRVDCDDGSVESVRLHRWQDYTHSQAGSAVSIAVSLNVHAPLRPSASCSMAAGQFNPCARSHLLPSFHARMCGSEDTISPHRPSSVVEKGLSGGISHPIA